MGAGVSIHASHISTVTNGEKCSNLCGEEDFRVRQCPTVKGQMSAATRLCVSAGQGGEEVRAGRGGLSLHKAGSGHHLTLQTRKLRPEEGRGTPKTVSPMHTRAMDFKPGSSPPAGPG